MKCKYEACEKDSHSKGYCKNHYQMYRYHNIPGLKELILERNKIWRDNNKEKYNEISRTSQARWREDNREHYNEYHRNYRKIKKEESK